MKKKIILIVALVFISWTFVLGSVSAAGTITISPTTATLAPNSNVTVSWSGLAGLPAGAEVYIWVNEAETTYAVSNQSSISISVTVASGFNMNGTNSVQAWIGDSSGNQITSAPQASQSYTISTTPGSTPPTTPASGVDCTKTPNNTSCVYNPLPTNDLVTFILLIMKWLLGVIGIIAVLFIMIGGFKMITAQGAEEAVTAARKTITWAVIGLVVAVLSFSMIAIVENILQANINAVSVTTQSRNKL